MATQQQKFIPLIIILGLPLVLMGLSYGLIYLYKHQSLNIPELVGTQTVGQLVTPPIKVEKLNLVSADDQPFSNRDKTAPWTLLVLPTSPDNVIQSRQMHIALGKHMPKLNRVYATEHALTSHALEQFKNDHPKLRFASGLQADPLFNTNDYLLIDPRGWVMMTYAKGTDEKAMMDDLKHLFKYAQ
ncbi:MAG: hypothetical protein OXE99_01065 [Cellvibrionales bacterium]|nr:hypothetical protein [Cellvibrionales bacterium]